MFIDKVLARVFWITLLDLRGGDVLLSTTPPREALHEIY